MNPIRVFFVFVMNGFPRSLEVENPPVRFEAVRGTVWRSGEGRRVARSAKGDRGTAGEICSQRKPSIGRVGSEEHGRKAFERSMRSTTSNKASTSAKDPAGGAGPQAGSGSGFAGLPTAFVSGNQQRNQQRKRRALPHNHNNLGVRGRGRGRGGRGGGGGRNRGGQRNRGGPISRYVKKSFLEDPWKDLLTPPVDEKTAE